VSNLGQLEKAWRDAEARAVKLQGEKDEALAKVSDRFSGKLADAVDAAAAAQKEFLDAQVIEELKDRPDGEAVARTLGLSLD
jgi:hypothetical protein